MEAQSLGPRRLPDDIVLGHPRAGPTGQRRHEPADLGAEHQARHGVVGFPPVADLARPVRRIATLLPIPFVGIEPRLEPALEQPLEPPRHRRRFLWCDEAIENEESVVVEG